MCANSYISALKYCVIFDVRSAILKFDVHSAFAISHPIYEMQENSITQISVNVYMHPPDL